jgi:hypothetical protein
MKALSENEIRTSFVNCSKGEARRMRLPLLREIQWEDLDFLGWRDPGAPERGYLVAEHDGSLVGVALRASTEVRRSFTKSTICSVCVTPHSGTGVALFTAARVGESGRQGNTVGTYLCSDLACSLYVRGKRHSDFRMRFESLTDEERILRLQVNMEGFLSEILSE